MTTPCIAQIREGEGERGNSFVLLKVIRCGKYVHGARERWREGRRRPPPRPPTTHTRTHTWLHIAHPFHLGSFPHLKYLPTPPTSPATNKQATDAGLYFILFGIICSFFTTFWSLGLVRLGEKLRKSATQLNLVPPRTEVVRQLSTGLTVNFVGLGGARHTS
jgi:hypothetical protein